MLLPAARTVVSQRLNAGDLVAVVTATNSFGITIRAYIKESFPNVEYIVDPRYATVGGNVVQLIAKEFDGNKTGYCAFNEKSRDHAVELRILEWQVFSAGHFNEGQPRIHARRDDVRADFIAVFENNTLGLPIPDDDLVDRRFGSDLDSSLPGGRCNRVGYRTGPSANESPGPKGAIDFAHVMVKQDVGRAG